MKKKVRIGISSCLLGNPVRYDGTAKSDYYIKHIPGEFIEWVPVCPEVECGLTVPREAMQLTGNPGNIRIVTIHTQVDVTDILLEWAENKLAELTTLDLKGFIFKSRSPSCGIKDINLYDSFNLSIQESAGLFANAFMNHFNTIPVEDEEGINDPVIRELFMKKTGIWSD
jgi:uncharacterized protein YbbK (DUF523 family)